VNPLCTLCYCTAHSLLGMHITQAWDCSRVRALCARCTVSFGAAPSARHARAPVQGVALAASTCVVASVMMACWSICAGFVHVCIIWLVAAMKRAKRGNCARCNMCASDRVACATFLSHSLAWKLPCQYSLQLHACKPCSACTAQVDSATWAAGSKVV
jgi:hypothetical protein